MSYLRKRYRRRAPRQVLRGRAAAMGDIGTTITNLATAAGVAVDIGQDPYLPETMCRIGQLKAIHASGVPGACNPTQAGLKGGVGLGPLMQPLRAYVYAEQHPWVYGAALVVAVGLPLALGYAIGRTR